MRNEKMRSKQSAAQRFLTSGLFDGLNSFAEIEARISVLPGNKERGDAFELFAEAYLATQKINEAREVWPFEAIPLEQRKLLALDTGRDMGVDGTYQTHDGELRAYQVKFRSNRPALTWDELSTFMGLTDQVSQRVLFTNCETLPSLMRDRSGFIAIRGSDLDRLMSEDFEAMRLWLQSGQVKLSRKPPKPHQKEALAAIASELDKNDRTTVVMACGTGKSLVALWAAEQRGCRNILVLLPSLALVRQLLHEWLRETSWEKLAYLCVCSDPTVAKGADDLIVHQADLDFPVTTESAAVGKFLGKPFDGVKVVFSTYQSAHIVAEDMPIGANGERQPFELGIFDEAHKTASRSGTQFSFALADENLPIRKRLFFTATPRHYDIRKKDKEGDNTLVYSMDRPEVYGQVAYTLSFAKAARDDIICDYKVVISMVTSEMLNDYVIKHGEVIVAGDAVKARQVALQIALQKAVEKYSVSRIFTFHGSVAAARSFTSDDGEGIRQHLKDFQALHVSGTMRTSEREDYMKAFRLAKKVVMSNARCLTEGVDVPAVDMVAFMSPRKSKVDIVQATGRAMRRSDETGKKLGYVMVPLFLDMTINETIEEALHRTDFSDVWDVLSAMKEQDDVLIDIIRQMREDKGRIGGYDDSRFRERIEVLGPSVSLEVIRNSITAECVESLGATWDERYGELLAYRDEHGNVNVSASSTGLGVWVTTQRQTRKNGKLSEEKIRLLDELGFVWEPFDAKWEQKYLELLSFKETHGNVNVPRHYSTDLGTWVHNQRHNRKVGAISEDRIQRLDEIGFEWEPVEAQWNEQYEKLAMYKAKHGNLDAPQRSSTKLGLWSNSQRQNRKNGILTAERIRLLDEIGFEWTPRDSVWDEGFNKLLAYKAEHGNVDVSKHPNTELGTWVSVQRKAKSRGEISEERLQRLNEVGFVWDAHESRWEEMFRQLRVYKDTHGDLNIPTASTGLGSWAHIQRRAKKNGKLSEEKIQRLNEVEFAWGFLESKWEEKYNELVAYSVQHESVNVPARLTGLGSWVSIQRKNKRTGTLSKERIDLLDKIGFDWEPPMSPPPRKNTDADWSLRYKELRDYKAAYGDTNVPGLWVTGLGRWASTQRQARKNGKLSEERTRLLEEIGFEWVLKSGRK